MKRVLVTGATGFIGRHALPLLVGQGWDVQAVSSRPEAPDVPGVTWHRADLLDAGEAERVCRQARATHLLHLAWYLAPGKWAAAPENLLWVQASLALLQAFKDAGGVRVAAAGSCLEYDWNYGYCSEARTPTTPHTLYGRCKHALQTLTEDFPGLSTVWGRIFFLYGPHEHPDRLVASVVRSLLAGQPALCSHGNQIRDYLYAGDVAEAFVRLLESDVTGPINIASGQPVALKDIVTRIGDLTGRSDLIRLGAIPAAATDTPLVVGDPSRLFSGLGWRPGYDLDRGLGATISWWKAR